MVRLSLSPESVHENHDVTLANGRSRNAPQTVCTTMPHLGIRASADALRVGIGCPIEVDRAGEAAGDARIEPPELLLDRRLPVARNGLADRLEHGAKAAVDLERTAASRTGC
jgi:hypothetical protein